MDHYLEITLLPDAEFPATVLMNSLYSKLHKALVDLKSRDIGVSFPKKEKTLGNVLRLHGSTQALEALQKRNWIGAMASYCNISEVRPVPGGVKHRTLSRKQSTMSFSKLRRLQKRGAISDDEVKQYKAKMFAKGFDDPYLQLISGSNGHRHRRYIEFGELQDEPSIGQFDQFGLSKTATVPWFE